MEEKKDRQQGQSHEIPTAGSEDKNAHLRPGGSSSRPRIVPDAERAIQVGTDRIQQRAARETAKTRGLEISERPAASASGAIRHQEKRAPQTQAAITNDSSKPCGRIEDRETARWAAWGALLISVVALILVTIYSMRDFGPGFDLYNFKVTQQALVADVRELKNTTHLENVKIAVLSAYFQLLVRKDYAAAEAELASAKAGLDSLLNSLPIEKSAEPRQIRSSIERTIQEIQSGPSSLDSRLNSILTDIEMIAPHP